MQEGILVLSSKTGRYALSSLDITSGIMMAIKLNGQWVEGTVEHTGGIYAEEGNQGGLAGYYFADGNGLMCGLCVGMRVRL